MRAASHAEDTVARTRVRVSEAIDTAAEVTRRQALAESGVAIYLARTKVKCPSVISATLPNIIAIPTRAPKYHSVSYARRALMSGGLWTSAWLSAPHLLRNGACASKLKLTLLHPLRSPWLIFFCIFEIVLVAIMYSYSRKMVTNKI